MNANLKGNILVRADRLNDRIDEFAHYFLNLEENEEQISRKSFREFIKSLHLIVATELSAKGVERQWKK